MSPKDQTSEAGKIGGLLASCSGAMNSALGAALDPRAAVRNVASPRSSTTTRGAAPSSPLDIKKTLSGRTSW